MGVISRHLTASGEALLQLGSDSQMAALGPEIEYAGLRVLEVRRYDGGVLARIARR